MAKNNSLLSPRWTAVAAIVVLVSILVIMTRKTSGHGIATQAMPTGSVSTPIAGTPIPTPTASSPTIAPTSPAPTTSQPVKTVSIPTQLRTQVTDAVRAYYDVHVVTTNGTKQIVWGWQHMPSFTLHPDRMRKLTGLDAGLNTMKDMCLELVGAAVPSSLRGSAVAGNPKLFTVTGLAQTEIFYGTADCQLGDSTVQDGTPFKPPDNEPIIYNNPFTSRWEQVHGKWFLVDFLDEG